jgi:hypothetical protein
LEPYKNS